MSFLTYPEKKEEMLKEVTVKVEDLLIKLKENRENHIKEYEESLAAYKESAKETLNAARAHALAKIELNYEEIQSKIDKFDPEQSDGWFTLVEREVVNAPIPKNYSEEYDKAISMLEWEQQSEIQLASDQFDRFILDRWEFTEDFKTLNAMYIK